jgi:hypothetical protein
MPQPDLRLPMADRLDEALPHPDGSRGSYAFGINVWRGHPLDAMARRCLARMADEPVRFPQDQVAIVVMNRTENRPARARIAREWHPADTG